MRHSVNVFLLRLHEDISKAIVEIRSVIIVKHVFTLSSIDSNELENYPFLVDYVIYKNFIEISILLDGSRPFGTPETELYSPLEAIIYSLG